jgi:hypothetical protein
LGCEFGLGNGRCSAITYVQEETICGSLCSSIAEGVKHGKALNEVGKVGAYTVCRDVEEHGTSKAIEDDEAQNCRGVGKNSAKFPEKGHRIP